MYETYHSQFKYYTNIEFKVTRAPGMQVTIDRKALAKEQRRTESPEVYNECQERLGILPSRT